MAKSNISYCKFTTLKEDVSMHVMKELTDLNFKILSITPLTFEGENISTQQIRDLVSLLEGPELLQEKASLDQAHQNTVSLQSEAGFSEINDFGNLSDDSEESFIVLQPNLESMSEYTEIKQSNLQKCSENASALTPPYQSKSVSQPHLDSQISNSAKSIIYDKTEHKKDLTALLKKEKESDSTENGTLEKENDDQSELSSDENTMLQNERKVAETYNPKNISNNESDESEEQLAEPLSKYSEPKFPTKGIERKPSDSLENDCAPSTFKASGQKESTVERSITSNEPVDYLIRNQLTVSIRTGHATDFESDCILLIGNLFKEISGHSDFNTKQHVSVTKTSDDVELCSLHKPDSSGLVKLLCLVKKDLENLKDKQHNLPDTIERGLVMANCSGQLDKNLECVVVSSSCLYSSKGGEDKKTVGTLSKVLIDVMDNITGQNNSLLSVSKITIVASAKWASVVSQVFSTRAITDSDEIEEVPRGNTPAFHVKTKKPQAMGGDDTAQTTQLIYPNSDPSHDFTGASDSALPQRCKCTICDENLVDQQLQCCGAGICGACFSLVSPQCPFCRKVFSNQGGNQPKGGIMTCLYNSFNVLPGYEYAIGSFCITYSFEGGFQERDHPHPGKRYSGTTYTAYLPFTEDGCYVLVLLHVAFLRRLIFTVATSNTTELDDQIVWNIHHKTSRYGGRTNCGYPDPYYTQRVLAELANVGVTLDSMTSAEFKDVRDFLAKSFGSIYLQWFQLYLK